jgi:phosphomannomutase / phosphoglucomutase
MTTISSSLFKKYDIRGKALGVNPPLTRDAALTIGQAIGTYLQRTEAMQRVIVGRDNRATSYDLQQALMEGMRRSSMKVIDIGLVSTPLVYWHAVHEGNIGGVMVTGSHLAPEYNGFKICVGNRNIYGAGIQSIASLIEESHLAYGASEGEITVNARAYSQYINDLSERIKIPRSLKVVVDPGNGTGGIFAPRLMEHWGMEMTGIFIEPDATYPNHQPDPSDAKNLVALAAKVRETGADIGIAFDGDADRMGVVDEQGNPIAADRILALLAQDMLTRHPGAAVVGDVLCSQVLFDAVKDAGGVPYMAASGHSIVKDMMRAKRALLGGEMSGHIFVGEDYFGFDDGYLVAGRVLQLLAHGTQTMSQLDAGLPRLYSTPEYRPHCADDAKTRVIAGVRAALESKGILTDVDGIRVQFEQGWGILRASNTEPVLSLRFEAVTEADALTYRDLFVQALTAYPEVEKFV